MYEILKNSVQFIEERLAHLDVLKANQKEPKFLIFECFDVLKMMFLTNVLKMIE